MSRKNYKRIKGGQCTRCCIDNPDCHFIDEVRESYNKDIRQLKEQKGKEKTEEEICNNYKDKNKKITYCDMFNLRRDYHKLEKIGDESSIREAINKRKLWLDEYYKNNCRKCDFNRANHEQAIYHLNVELNRIIEKKNKLAKKKKFSKKK